MAYLYYLGLRLVCLKKNNTLLPKKVKKEAKRDRSESASEGDDDLVCPICTDLAVDSCQVTCCGALFCRACITPVAAARSPKCPMCWAVCGPDKVVPDVRSERASKNTTRPCRHKARGCTFKGDREAVVKHEPGCGHVPPVDFPKKNAELEQQLTQLTLDQQNLLVERDALKSESAFLKSENASLKIHVATLREEKSRQEKTVTAALTKMSNQQSALTTANDKIANAAKFQMEMSKKLSAVLFLDSTKALHSLLMATDRGCLGWRLKRSELSGTKSIQTLARA